MTGNEVIQRYFEWLTERVDCDEYHTEEYQCLLQSLFHTEFTWLLEMDGNRADDGIGLRFSFYREEPDVGDILILNLPEYCTVLEMLIALATRCERDVMYDPDYGDRTALWFWVMVENLGLSGFSDRVYRRNPRVIDQDIDNCLELFMDREFEPDGTGSIFRVHTSQMDMRDVDLWYQMQYYMNENFDI